MILVFVFSMSAFGAPADLIELRESVRDIAKSNNCVECHLPGRAGALQRILDIYNLRNTHWSASLDDSRLKKFQERMSDVLDKSEFAVVDSFVKKELAFRKREPGARLQEQEQNRRERALNELGILRQR
jgi:hypothetical protein